MSTPTFKFEKRAGPRWTFELEGAANVTNRRVNDGGLGIKVLTVNVGAGGLMLTHDGEVNIGDLLRVTFRAPYGQEPPAVAAQVVWQRRNGMRLLGAFTAGLSFRPASQEDAVRLAALARAGVESRQAAATPGPESGGGAR